jgi:hypothetical protein
MCHGEDLEDFNTIPSDETTVGAQGAVAPLVHRIVWCTTDSPVNYSGARLTETREWLVWKCTGLMHRTVYSTPKISTLKSFCSIFIVSITRFLSWFVLNLMHM